MKKSIMIFAMMLMIGFSSVFANNVEGVNEKALKNFKKEFVHAREVNWQVNKAFTKVTFMVNDQVLFAYYSQEGERIALIRNLISSQLPMVLESSLKNSYDRHWISDLFEVVSENEMAYYVTIENAEQKIVLKSVGTTGWLVYKKSHKD